MRLLPLVRAASRARRRWIIPSPAAAPSTHARPIIGTLTHRSASFSARTSPQADAAPSTGDGGGNNANPDEISKFSSFASHWWDSRSNPLMGMNPIRVKFMTEVVRSFQPPSPAEAGAANLSDGIGSLPLANKRVLDIGCGGGLLTESMARLGAALVVGVDASPKVVEVAKLHSFHDNSHLAPPAGDDMDGVDHQGGIRYIGGTTVEDLAAHWLSEHDKERQQSSEQPQTHDLFDVVTALEVIEHVPNPSSLLRAASSLLKPNGILFVSTINRTAKSYGLAIVAAECLSGKVPVGTHDWNQFRSPEEVERMIVGKEATMERIALNGMVIEPPFVNLRWRLDAHDVDVNWIGAYRKRGDAA